MATNTHSQMLNNNRQTYLENLIEVIPYFIFWKNTESVYLGCNQKFAALVGEKCPKDVIGKTDFDLGWRKEDAELFLQGDKETMSGLPKINIEEILTQPDGSLIVMLVNKVPLLDANSDCIGILGTSTDITAQKEAERLLLESERQRHQIVKQEKENYATRVRKVAHDINSPVAALNMMLEACNELPEEKRIFLRRATESILDIANNLLSHDRQEENLFNTEIEHRELLLLSDLLVHLLSEKKVQYQERAVTFNTVIPCDAQFAFILVQRSEFQRAMSNLINNAVDALEHYENAIVTVQLTVEANSVIVDVRDNGKGMPLPLIEKIQNYESFTEGKENGHGIGLQQVWDMLECNQGTMEVQSLLCKGTSMQLTFPRMEAPNWIAQEIHLIPENIIVILDDDQSIHTAWDLRFGPLTETHPTLKLHHFTHGQKALNFLATLHPTEKDQVIFLTDYELLHQDRNGLQIIEVSGISNAILVTSYYSNLQIRAVAEDLSVKVLPKQMASIIPIDMNFNAQTKLAH